jgi:hypothetical protein
MLRCAELSGAAKCWLLKLYEIFDHFKKIEENARNFAWRDQIDFGDYS